MSYVIYRAISPSLKIYIGQTKNINKRLNTYKNIKKVTNRFSASLKKYGFENFKWDIVVDDLPNKNHADMWERLWIYVEKSNDPKYGYNMTEGGDDNPSSNPEVRLKISQTKIKNNSAKGNKNPMYGVRRYGKDNPNFGKKHPNINRTNFYNGWLGKKHKEETKQKMRKPKSEETKRKMSEASKGRIPWNKGIKGYKNGKKKNKQIQQSENDCIKS